MLSLNCPTCNKADWRQSPRNAAYNICIHCNTEYDLETLVNHEYAVQEKLLTEPTYEVTLDIFTALMIKTALEHYARLEVPSEHLPDIGYANISEETQEAFTTYNNTLVLDYRDYSAKVMLLEDDINNIAESLCQLMIQSTCKFYNNPLGKGSEEGELEGILLENFKAACLIVGVEAEY